MATSFDKQDLSIDIEQHSLLLKLPKNRVEYPRQKSIHQLFEDQSKVTPNRTAVLLPDLDYGKASSIDYQELNRRATVLASILQRHKVKPGMSIAIMMDRSIEMIVAIVGILKAGGAYVPLAPSYPAERLAWMLSDSQSPIILTQSKLVSSLPSHQAEVICLEEGWGKDLELEKSLSTFTIDSYEVAYVNYTSGSTGKPKGVTVPHRGVVRLVFGTEFTLLDGNQNILQLAPVSFDAATFEIWGALLHGGCCVLYPEDGLPDPQTLGRTIADFNITTMWLTAALFNTLIAEAPECLQGVKEILTGGEALSVSHIRKAHELLPDTQLINGYGPTENTTFTCCYRIPKPLPEGLTSIPIGKAIANTDVYVLDENLNPVAPGEKGELYIGGDGLATGYLNRPDMTAAKFITHSLSEGEITRLYKTGDEVRYLPDNNLEFVGRLDNQVKLRGYRIELGEIETALVKDENVRDAVVICREDNPGNKYLAAYIIPQDDCDINSKNLKDYLYSQLPEYMVPSNIVVIEKLPLTANGKLDRKALPMPIKESSQPNSAIATGSEIEKSLAQIWSDILGLKQISLEDNFFDLGGTSLLSLQLISRIQKSFNIQLRGVKLYQYPSIRKLAQYIAGQTTPSKTKLKLQPSQNKSTELTEGIAIVGMVGKFPGANNVDQFWDNLCQGKESSTWFADEEIDPSVDRELLDDPNYVRAKGVVEGAELFDASFFNISPREAEVIDPQARVFLELAYEALENAGYTAESCAGKIGLYAGSGQNTYFENHLCGRKEIIDRLGAFQTMLGNEKDFVTSRISYKLNLTGPSISINTACSTSLVAIIQAFQGLKGGQCDMALAGGISINTPQNRGYLHQEGGMLSADGCCRPFDASGDGTLFNNGAGIVVLKRVEDALEDGDRIYAVIRGVGMNNDGSDKVSFTAPSVNGQMSAILEAQQSAGIDPTTIDYIETHGTATHLGDPIELEALTQAFQTQTDATQFCAIGSVKSNVGHLVAAAGVTGVIKTALSLYNQQIPPSLNFESPNPEIDFDNSPFYVNSKLTDWEKKDRPRRAGISSFGVGGTNAHIILEEAPKNHLSINSEHLSGRKYELLTISAKTETALEQKTSDLKEYLEQNPDIALADVAFTLQQGRQSFNHCRFVVCKQEEAVNSLETLPPIKSATRYTEKRNRKVVFMFPGQGSQYVNMGANFYRDEPLFRSVVDRCAQILQPLLELDIREILYPQEQNEASAALLKQTNYTQPILFTIEYALAQLWISWGVEPVATIGHSIGEYVSACLGGVFSLEDALKLVATRGKMMWNLPSGAMLSVRLPAKEVEPMLTPELAIAAINSPFLCVVSGTHESITKLEKELTEKEIVCKLLHTSHAFHSPMMDSIIEPFAEVVKEVELSSPKIPFVSTVTADWITDDRATDPNYWANHLRATVKFAEGIQTLWQQPERLLLEVGPRKTAATLARQQAKDLRSRIAVSSLGSQAEDDLEWAALLQALGQLWSSGVSIDWRSYSAGKQHHRLPLPTYPFERKRYWIDPIPAMADIDRSNLIATADRNNSTLIPTLIKPTTVMSNSRKERLIPMLQEVLEDTSGLELAGVDESMTFLEMGLDSLSLTQVAIALKKKFKVKITFRNLLEDVPSLDTLAEFLDTTLAVDAIPAPEAPITVSDTVPATAITTSPINNGNGNGSNGNNSQVSYQVMSQVNTNPVPSSGMEGLVAQQLQIMNQQLELLRQGNLNIPTPIVQPQPSVTTVVTPSPAPAPVAKITPEPSKSAKMHGPGAKIKKSKDTGLSSEQQKGIDSIIDFYTKRTPESKRQTQSHRPYLSDPRTVSGFSPLLKEIVYPIVTDRSAGSRLWDVDGNEYIDLTNGFGLNFFGWSPEFIKEAVVNQMDRGIEIGPQSPLAGKVAKMITEFTGMERVAFSNTGSEAVMAALRLARTVTGRNTIAIFKGAYHGTFDEVIVRSGANHKSLPAAPGIMSSMFENILVLDYGTPESLAILRDRADDLAAIMVEPVQSRKPQLQPVEFLRDLRELTQKSETALIFDEVVTGFRVHPGGAQAYFNIQADLATYGKIVGGGIPIGVVAGKAEYMDALDGGFWQYGDSSIPEIGVTFFAGTFVRHPMALAAAEAVLTKLKEGGVELQQSLSIKVERFVKHLREYLESVGAPININYFSSFFYITYPDEATYGGLLFYLLRSKGVHVWESRPCFFTLAHTDEDIEFVIRAFKDSVAQLQNMGLLPGKAVQAISNGKGDRNSPPQPGARLGKDPQGNPAWYILDPDRPGKYLQVGLVK